MSGSEDTRSGVGRTVDIPRRTVLKAGSGLLGLAGVSGTVQTASEGVDRPVAAETRWGRLVSIHPRWYWGGADTVEESRRAMRDWLDMAAMAGVNVLQAWIESPGAAALLGEPLYADRYEFWDTKRWDALGELITEAAARGMSVHLWYSVTRYKRNRDLVPEYDPDLAVLPPGDPGWASIKKSEYEQGLTDPSDPRVDGDALCNNEFEAHNWSMELLRRLFEQYPGLNGLKIEEPGYLAADRCVCPRCQAVYSNYYDEPGGNLLDHIYGRTEPYYDDDRAVPVKTRGTDEMARRVYDWWDRSGPSDGLFYAGSWLSRWDRVRGRNWATWSERGLIPYYIPQTFARTVPVFEWKLRTTMESISDSAVLPGVGIIWGFGENGPEQVAAQIETSNDFDGVRNTPIAGAGLFSGGAFTPELARTLRTGPYATESIPPWQSLEDRARINTAAVSGELDRLDPFVWNDGPSGGLPGDDVTRPARQMASLTGGELGTVTHYQSGVDDWGWVDLLRPYDNPVVIMKPLSYNGFHPCHPRIGNVMTDSFAFKWEEWQYLDDTHRTERAHYLVLDAGTLNLDGLPAEAGHVRTSHEPARFEFEQDFSPTPVVFTQAQTVNGPNPVVTRNMDLSVGGVTVQLQEEEDGEHNGTHLSERIGYLAVEPGSGTAFGRTAEVGRSQLDVDGSWHRIHFSQSFDNPWLVADLQTFEGFNTASLRYRNLTGSGVDVFVEEEQSRDGETDHTDESVGYLVVEGG